MKTLSVNCTFCGFSFQKPIAYIKQGKKRGYLNHFCSNKCSLEFNKQQNKKLPKKREQEYLKNPKICPQCQSIIPYKDKNWKIYCSSRCSVLYWQKDIDWQKDVKRRHWTAEEREKIGKRFKKERIKKICPTCNKIFEILPRKINQKCCSHKCKKEWMIKTNYLKNKGFGGYREKGGRGKQGWYKGYYCNSSWELAWVIYNLDHNSSFIRNTKGFDYVFENRHFKFYPDFVLPDGTYIEVKGYMDKKNQAKISHFPHQIKIIDRNEIKHYIDYVEQKYGKDYIKLYENI